MKHLSFKAFGNRQLKQGRAVKHGAWTDPQAEGLTPVLGT